MQRYRTLRTPLMATVRRATALISTKPGREGSKKLQMGPAEPTTRGCGRRGGPFPIATTPPSRSPRCLGARGGCGTPRCQDLGFSGKKVGWSRREKRGGYVTHGCGRYMHSCPPRPASRAVGGARGERTRRCKNLGFPRVGSPWEPKEVRLRGTGASGGPGRHSLCALWPRAQSTAPSARMRRKQLERPWGPPVYRCRRRMGSPQP